MIGPNREFRMCDVCRLVDYDTEKKWCGYCNLCDAWICDTDLTAYVRRALAAVRRKLEPGYRGSE